MWRWWFGVFVGEGCVGVGCCVMSVGELFASCEVLTGVQGVYLPTFRF